MPSVHAPLEFDDLCARLKDFDPAILLYEGEGRNDLRSVWKNYKSCGEGANQGGIIIIGPEGGFTATEVETALSHGAIATSLGTQILRVETAAVVALSICQYELGNMDAH
jgi:16S rRNA (uracil1498-N3)-methyltransferase